MEENGTTPSLLREVNVPLRETGECKLKGVGSADEDYDIIETGLADFFENATAEEKRLKRLRFKHRLNTYFICASSFNARDSCQGDSGGPFSIQGWIV